MGKVLYIDPFGGAAGDMLMGALIDLGVEAATLERVLLGLRLPGWKLAVERDRQQGFAGTRVRVEADEVSYPARHFADVERLLREAELPQGVRERSLAAFRCLFEAEAEVHGVPFDKAHLHELAAIDAVVDIVGVCAAVELLGVDGVVCGPVPVGTGSVKTAHGLLPVPAPAVARLLLGIPIAAHAADGEMTTPTGATLLRTLVRDFGPPPAGTILHTGVGLGTRHFQGMPNVLRAFLIEETVPRLAGRSMVLVETTVDDLSGEAMGYLTDRLREIGARDAWCLAGTGRKGRPISELRALVEPGHVDAVVAALFAEGATLGVRLVSCVRPELERHIVDVTTRFGVIPVKVGVFEGLVVSAKPEHDDCAKAARSHDVSFVSVVEAVRAAAPQLNSVWPDPGRGSA
jgi:pyridinium-3,5-bisthiocarboxylic acid mononucleotide nickel chelatase